MGSIPVIGCSFFATTCNSHLFFYINSSLGCSQQKCTKGNLYFIVWLTNGSRSHENWVTNDQVICCQFFEQSLPNFLQSMIKMFPYSLLPSAKNANLIILQRKKTSSKIVLNFDRMLQNNISLLKIGYIIFYVNITWMFHLASIYIYNLDFFIIVKNQALFEL